MKCSRAFFIRKIVWSLNKLSSPASKPHEVKALWEEKSKGYFFAIEQLLVEDYEGLELFFSL